MSNTGTWAKEYYDGSLLYPDHRTVLVHKLVNPTLAESFIFSTEAWHAQWKGYLNPKGSYVLFEKGDLNQLGFSCSDPNSDLFLPLQFLVDLSNKQYDWNTGYKPKDSNNNDLYGIIDTANSFRSVDPKNGLTLLINPVGAQNGITNGQVVNAFKRVTTQMMFNTTYIYEPEAGKTFADYTLLWTSPFSLYETWIRTDEILSNIEEDRPFPQGSVSVGTTLTEWAKGVYKVAQKTPSDPVAQIGLTYEQFLAGVKQGAGTPTAINADKIEEAIGKRKEVKPQKSAMGGLSATDWLHLIAFSFGGIGAGNSYHHSQLSLNFIFGTAECNSLMYRYESSWQVLYKYEAELRKLSQKAGPQGQVQAQINDGLTVKPLHPPSGAQWIFGNNPNGLHETLAKSFPWLCYALRYHITMEECLVFSKANTFDQVVDFFPFTRPFFTKAEALVDRFLLDELYYK
ncbi:hypothetical protein M431DRAFT_6792 [Trichoderma harzianum CBS 226.95]|uniref:Uncharacterized protein n=1 Tax=Trichoderma harzianum CBS 226.95 TaxID=983964 RepID=A0A2T4A8B4_TRIHA|nr:hypothetical protein M431DRAFT_6792 [Trichoderma harzianum CBS 226.95]PTB53233.1 hypothetical protein M431DRAFT_6792 [Trichoderma harzianum CBS 226.95]